MISSSTSDISTGRVGFCLMNAAAERTDAFEARRFLAQADAALAWRKELSTEHLAQLRRSEADIDAAFEGIA